MSALEHTGSEADPEPRFHRLIHDLHFRAVAPDPQNEPASTACRRCGAEDCPGCPTLRRTPPVDTGWGLEYDGPDAVEGRIERDRERWAS